MHLKRFSIQGSLKVEKHCKKLRVKSLELQFPFHSAVYVSDSWCSGWCENHTAKVEKQLKEKHEVIHTTKNTTQITVYFLQYFTE